MLPLREKVSGNSLCGFAGENVACQTSLPSIMKCLYSGWGGSSGQIHLNTASSMISRGFCVLRLGGWTTRRVTNWLDCWASERMANSCCLDTSDTLGFSRSSGNVHCLCFWMMGQSQILQAHHWHSAGEQGRETQNVEVLGTCLTKNLSNLIKLWR